MYLPGCISLDFCINNESIEVYYDGHDLKIINHNIIDITINKAEPMAAIAYVRIPAVLCAR